MTDLDAQLAGLEASNPRELKARWHQIVRIAAPDVGPDLLRRAIAYKLQEKNQGKLTRSAVSAISKLEQSIERTGDVGTGAQQLKVGTRLTRSWHGKMHQVLVCEEGFEFEGRRYRSLSQIAKAITGSHWSGPRFFGLNSSGRRQGDK